ncbi:MAG: hypothetical protein DRO99_02540, partial [Candidatus Aenigmatarchaeota archaeon]
MRAPLVLTAVILLSLAVPVSAAVEHITDCRGPFNPLEDPDTVYILDNDITSGITDMCMVITAENITLDCNGHEIKEEVPFTAIYSEAESSTIRGCNVDMKSQTNLPAIKLVGANNSYLYNNTAVFNNMGIYVVNSSNVTLEKNTVQQNFMGMTISGGSGNMVLNNTIMVNFIIMIPGGSFGVGLAMVGTTGNIVHGNDILLNPYNMQEVGCSGNNITGNTFYGFPNLMNSYGISMSSTSSDLVMGNTFYKHLNTAMNAEESDHNVFRGNNLTMNLIGFYLKSGSDSNTITDNLINRSRSAVMLSSSTGNIVESNIIPSCTGSFCVSLANSDGNMLSLGSGLSYSGNYVLYLQGSNNNVIYDTTLTNSGDYGIGIVQNSVNNTFLNCSYDKMTIEPGSEAVSGWYVDILVNNGTKPVQGAIVNMDNEDWTSSETTGLDGYIARQNIVGFVKDNTSESQRTFQVIASKPGHISDSWGPAQVTDNMVIG